MLPAGPTVLDVVANAAFFYGLVQQLRTADRPLWTRLAFQSAAGNFLACARHGLEATVYWPGIGEIPVAELIIRHLIPQAAAGLEDLGVEAELIGRYLDVIRERARTEQNGAAWQIGTLRQLESQGMDRTAALARLTRRYWANMHSNAPVHEWPLG